MGFIAYSIGTYKYIIRQQNGTFILTGSSALGLVDIIPEEYATLLEALNEMYHKG